MFDVSRRRARIAAVLVGIAVPVGGLGTLALTAAPVASAKSSRCSHRGPHHKTPHKDFDGDGCDRHSLDDGDGAKV